MENAKTTAAVVYKKWILFTMENKIAANLSIKDFSKRQNRKTPKTINIYTSRWRNTDGWEI